MRKASSNGPAPASELVQAVAQHEKRKVEVRISCYLLWYAQLVPANFPVTDILAAYCPFLRGLWPFRSLNEINS